MSTCSTCGAAAVVLLVHAVRVHKRVVSWTECISCFRKAEAR